MRKSLRKAEVVGVGVAALLLAGCGGGGGDDAEASGFAECERFADMEGDVRREALIKAAKEEGKLVIYSGGATMTELAAPTFEKEFGIDVESIWPGTGEKLRQRVLQEAQAGQARNDILETGALDMKLVYSPMDVLGKYQGPVLDEMPDDVVYDNWTGSYHYVLLPAWNKNKVAPSEVPQTLADLADPKWKGRLALVTDDYNWYLTLYQYYKDQGMSNDEFVEMFKRIAANATTSEGHSSSAGLLAAGEFALIPNEYQNVVLRVADEGAPLSSEPFVEPLVTYPNGIAPMKTAENCAAAILFMDWYLTEGQKLVVEDFELPANRDAIENPPEWFPEEDRMLPVPVEDLTEEEANAWRTAFDNLLRGDGDILPESVR